MKKKKTLDASINDLIIFVVSMISGKGEKITFEKLAKKCFDYFPDSFSLGSYPLPDSRKLDRPLRFLKSEKSMKESKDSGIFLTKEGKIKAGEIKKFLRQEKLKLKF